jgi:hypothetical protein
MTTTSNRNGMSTFNAHAPALPKHHERNQEKMTNVRQLMNSHNQNDTFGNGNRQNQDE